MTNIFSKKLQQTAHLNIKARHMVMEARTRQVRQPTVKEKQSIFADYDYLCITPKNIETK